MMILDKYDKDQSGDICFKDFKEVFQYLNENYETFSNINKGSNCTSDASELHQYKNCQFTVIFDKVIDTFKNIQKKLSLESFRKCKFFQKFS